MESIGLKLKASREQLGYTVEQIARETNIAKSYLIALEAEDFEAFPGETYLLGFMRNYSEYLGIDPEEMVNLYRNMMIQEQPAPMEELLDTGRSVPMWLPIAVVALLGLGALGYFYIYPNYLAGDSAPKASVQPEQPAVQQAADNVYAFTDEVIEKRFRSGDAVSYDLDGSSYLVSLKEVGEQAVFDTPSGEVRLISGGETSIDLNGDDTADLRLILRSLDAESSSVILHLDRFVKAIPQETQPEAVLDEPVRPVSTASLGEAGSEDRALETTVIRSGARPEPFALNIVFRGYCLLRYFSDNSVREERYFHKGETFRLEADSEVRLWVSNAGAVSGKVNGVDIDLGGAGEISTRSIQWVYNDAGSRYELQLIPMY